MTKLERNRLAGSKVELNRKRRNRNKLAAAQRARQRKKK